MNTTPPQEHATIDFVFNNKYNGRVAVKNPTELKEFVLAPKIHKMEGFKITLNPDQVWSAFENAGLAAQCGNWSHLYCWLDCAYKIPIRIEIPHSMEEQAAAFENVFEKYY